MAAALPRSALWPGSPITTRASRWPAWGLTWGDYDSDGRFDFFVTNYQWETNSLYRNLGNGFFADVTFQSGLGVPSLQFLAWGTLFIDYDNDGDRDLFVANGHLDDNIHLFDAVTYAQQNQLFRNREGHFADVSNQAGPGLLLQQVSRGAAHGRLRQRRRPRHLSSQQQPASRALAQTTAAMPSTI